MKHPKKIRKFYHCSSIRFKVGKVIGGALVRSRKYGDDKVGVYMSCLPYPHWTIHRDVILDPKKYNIFEVCPIGDVTRAGSRGEYFAMSAEVVRYVGNAKGQLGKRKTVDIGHAVKVKDYEI